MVQRLRLVPPLLVLLAGAACRLEPPADDVGASTAAFTGCQTINGIQVCDGFVGQYQKWGAPYPKVGLPKAEAFDYNGDRFQVFERVIMNEGRGLTFPDGRPVCDGACISFAGQIDAESALNTALVGGETQNCASDSLQRRGLGCLPAGIRGEVESNFLYYGYMISRVVPTCSWWDNGAGPNHTKCFWTERAKIGQTASGQWEFEALGWKLLEMGKIAGAQGARGKKGPRANCNSDEDCQSGKCSMKAGGKCSPDGECAHSYDVGVCSCAEHKVKQERVDTACKTGKYSQCTKADTCAAMYGKLGGAKECQRARNDVTNICYVGSSNGHDIEDGKVAKIIADCEQLIIERCN